MEKAEQLSHRIAEVEQLLNLQNKYKQHDASLLRPDLVAKHERLLTKLRVELHDYLGEAAAAQAAGSWQHNSRPVEELLAFEVMVATSEALRLEKVLTDTKLRAHHLAMQLHRDETANSNGAAWRIAELEGQLVDFQQRMVHYTPRREMGGGKTARILELEADLRASNRELQAYGAVVPALPGVAEGPIQRRASIDMEVTAKEPLALPAAPTSATRAREILEAARVRVGVSCAVCVSFSL